MAQPCSTTRMDLSTMLPTWCNVAMLLIIMWTMLLSRSENEKEIVVLFCSESTYFNISCVSFENLNFCYIEGFGSMQELRQCYWSWSGNPTSVFFLSLLCWGMHTTWLESWPMWCFFLFSCLRLCNFWEWHPSYKLSNWFSYTIL